MSVWEELDEQIGDADVWDQAISSGDATMRKKARGGANSAGMMAEWGIGLDWAKWGTDWRGQI